MGVPAPSSPSGQQPSASAASRLRRVLSLTQEHFALIWRRMVPLILCLFGGIIFAANDRSWVTAAVAAVVWAWALDLVASRAEAKGRSDMATRFYAMVMDDRYCEITVTTKHEYRADAATRAAIDALTAAQAIEARKGGDGEAGSVHESAVGNADAPKGQGHD